MKSIDNDINVQQLRTNALEFLTADVNKEANVLITLDAHTYDHDGTVSYELGRSAPLAVVSSSTSYHTNYP